MIVVAIVMVTFKMVDSFSSGGPEYSCKNQVPGHVNCVQQGPAPYRVFVSRTVIPSGGSTSVTLESSDDNPFRGFICAVSKFSDISGSPVGIMSASSSPQEDFHFLTCSRSGKDTAVTHTSKSDKFKVQFDWSPPSDTTSVQEYKIRCTVVMEFSKCWTNLQAIIITGSPPTQNITPHTQNITPRTQNITPRTQNITPHTQNITPTTQNITPRTQNINPPTQNITPRTQNSLFGKDPVSPNMKSAAVNAAQDPETHKSAPDDADVPRVNNLKSEARPNMSENHIVVAGTNIEPNSSNGQFVSGTGSNNLARFKNVFGTLMMNITWLSALSASPDTKSANRTTATLTTTDAFGTFTATNASRTDHVNTTEAAVPAEGAASKPSMSLGSVTTTTATANSSSHQLTDKAGGHWKHIPRHISTDEPDSLRAGHNTSNITRNL